MIPYLVAGAALGALSQDQGWPVLSYQTFGAYMTPTDENIEAEALAKAEAILVAREGKSYSVYMDSLGILTVGIGHKVLPSDGLLYGDEISDERVKQFFIDDVAGAFSSACLQAKELNKYNADMIAALTSVNFQLGTNWKSKFKNTWSLLVVGNKSAAVQRLVNSSWAKQTPQRVADFVEVINSQFA